MAQTHHPGDPPQSSGADAPEVIQSNRSFGSTISGSALFVALAGGFTTYPTEVAALVSHVAHAITNPTAATPLGLLTGIATGVWKARHAWHDATDAYRLLTALPGQSAHVVRSLRDDHLRRIDNWEKELPACYRI